MPKYLAIPQVEKFRLSRLEYLCSIIYAIFAQRLNGLHFRIDTAVDRDFKEWPGEDIISRLKMGKMG